MLNEVYKGIGCLKCPISQWECDAQYRGPRCAALRAKAGAGFDPEGNEGAAQNTKDDLISRQALLAEIKGPNCPEIYDGAQEADWILECIGKAPAVPSPTSPAPTVHGRWVDSYKSGYKPPHGAVCNKCDCWNEHKSSYCPNCGFSMDKEGDKNDR